MAKISYFLFLISLFFPLRLVLLSNSAYQTGAYSDFTSFSLYLSDILLLTTWWMLFLPRGESLTDFYHVVRKPLVLILWLILGIFLSFKSSISLNYYFLLKYAELIVAYGTSVIIFKQGFKASYLYWLFACLGAFESILALTQFLFQRSLGLKYLGENFILPNLLGIAKVVSGGTAYIRGYGTFPHPNLLSAFLVTASLFSLYLLTSTHQRNRRLLTSFLLIANLFGLTVTFSRAGFLAGFLGLGAFFVYLLIRRHSDFWQPLVLTLASALCALLVFWPLLSARATVSDQSTLDRVKYNRAGLEMIKANPIMGVGVGESVLHMEQYMGEALKPWEKQPVHNYFILAGAEIGIPGLAILLWIFFGHFGWLVRNLKQPDSLAPGLWLFVLLAFFTLMQFDHYFYTLEQTQLLLWTALGASLVLTTNGPKPVHKP